jgi:hypothetical protein
LSFDRDVYVPPANSDPHPTRVLPAVPAFETHEEAWFKSDPEYPVPVLGEGQPEVPASLVDDDDEPPIVDDREHESDRTLPDEPPVVQEQTRAGFVGEVSPPLEVAVPEPAPVEEWPEPSVDLATPPAPADLALPVPVVSIFDQVGSPVLPNGNQPTGLEAVSGAFDRLAAEEAEEEAARQDSAEILFESRLVAPLDLRTEDAAAGVIAELDRLQKLAVEAQGVRETQKEMMNLLARDLQTARKDIDRLNQKLTEVSQLAADEHDAVVAARRDRDEAERLMAAAFDDKKAAECEVARLTAALADAEERVRLAEQAEARLAEELKGAQKQIEAYRQSEAKAAMRAEKAAGKAEKKALGKSKEFATNIAIVLLSLFILGGVLYLIFAK